MSILKGFESVSGGANRSSAIFFSDCSTEFTTYGNSSTCAFIFTDFLTGTSC